MSYADKVFVNTVKTILERGISDQDKEVRPHWADGTPAHTLALFGVVERYDLEKEFPIMTLRRTPMKSAWDEIGWIWQKKSNNINDLNSHVWDEWADENGSIGKAYGYQMGKVSLCPEVTEAGLVRAFGHEYYRRGFEKMEGKGFLLDQVDHVIYQLVNDPGSRRILTNIYNIEELSEMALAPCAYGMNFVVTGNKLNGILSQRSQDMLAASNWNVVQYAMVIYAMASAYGFQPGEFVHMIGNCHIYDRHIPIIEELIKQPAYEAPTFSIDSSIRNFYDFTKDSFSLDGYQFNPFDKKIEIAI